MRINGGNAVGVGGVT